MALTVAFWHSMLSGAAGDRGIGGGPADEYPASTIVPVDITPPYGGQGRLHVFRKYFLNITSFVEGANAHTTADNVKLFLGACSSPEHLHMAATPDRSDALEGEGVVYGDISEITWVQDSGREVNLKRMPPFQPVAGRSHAITLYSNDSVEGGTVTVSTDIDDAVPFWVMFRLDENIEGGDHFHYTLNIVAEGASGSVFEASYGIPMMFGYGTATGVVEIDYHNGINLRDEYGNTTYAGDPLMLTLSGAGDLNTARLLVVSGDMTTGYLDTVGI